MSGLVLGASLHLSAVDALVMHVLAHCNLQSRLQDARSSTHRSDAKALLRVGALPLGRQQHFWSEEDSQVR